MMKEEKEFKVGQKVTAKEIKMEITEGIVKLVDEPGIIVSIKGLTEGYTNIHKYEVKTPSKTFFTNGRPHTKGSLSGLIV